jgi:hypothetical protein
MKSTIIRNVTLCNPENVHGRLGWNVMLPLPGLKNKTSKQQARAQLVASLTYSLIPKMEAVHSSETSVNFYQTTARRRTEDIIFFEVFYLLGYNAV